MAPLDSGRKRVLSALHQAAAAQVTYDGGQDSVFGGLRAIDLMKGAEAMLFGQVRPEHAEQVVARGIDKHPSRVTSADICVALYHECAETHPDETVFGPVTAGDVAEALAPSFEGVVEPSAVAAPGM